LESGFGAYQLIKTLEGQGSTREEIMSELIDPIPIKTHYSTIPPFQYSATMNPVSGKYEEILPQNAQK